MNRRQFLRTGLVGGLGALAAPMIAFGRTKLATTTAVEVSTRAVDLVHGTTVIDMMGLLTLDWPKLARWRQQPKEFRESDYRRLEIAGVDIFHPAVETSLGEPYDAVQRWLGGWNHLLASHGCFLAPIATISDLLHVPKRGPLGVVIGFQNSDHFRTRADVGAFYRLGQRVSQLTYNTTNRIGSGCFETRDRGLTAFGSEIVGEMNRVGMAIDISHCGERTSRDAIAASRRPVLVTHANCKALVPGQPRCKSDTVIRSLAAGGGVIGITVVRPFVRLRSVPTIDHLLDHFSHVAKVAGIEHVGLGSDVDITARDPGTGRAIPFYSIRGLDPEARVFQIADGLLRRGFSDRDVQLVLGGNFLRALTAIWPSSSWSPIPERETRRDPFCPAPRPPDPRGTKLG